jgi:cysteine desulfurase
MKRPIYLDHHATTPVDPRVLEAMLPHFVEDFGNASSGTHVYGWRAEAAVEVSRQTLAEGIGAAEPAEIVFTSGTTEANNLALQGVLRAAAPRRDHLVTTVIEHPSVLDVGRALEAEGFRVDRVPVDGHGLVDPDDVARALTDQTALVSVMTANSEIGTIQPIREIAAHCRERGVLFHTDAAQAVGKLAVDVRADGIDLLSMCAHKLYGPKGVGALYVRAGRPRLRLQPLSYGGGHEGGLRPGTLPVPLIVGFAHALSLAREGLAAEAVRVGALRDRLWSRLCEALDDLHCNGHPQRRLPGNLNVSFGGVSADQLLPTLPDLALSTGSACASGRAEPSHVLAALGLPKSRVRSALRLGLGRGNDQAQIDRAAERLIEEVQRIRSGGARGPGR